MSMQSAFLRSRVERDTETEHRIAWFPVWSLISAAEELVEEKETGIMTDVEAGFTAGQAREVLHNFLILIAEKVDELTPDVLAKQMLVHNGHKFIRHYNRTGTSCMLQCLICEKVVDVTKLLDIDYGCFEE